MDRHQQELILRMAKAESEKCKIVSNGNETKYFPTKVFNDLQKTVLKSRDIALLTRFAKIKGADVKTLGAVALTLHDPVGSYNAEFAKIPGADVDAHVRLVLSRDDVLAIGTMAFSEEIIPNMDYASMLEKVEELGAFNIAEALGETPEYANMYYGEIVAKIKEKLQKIAQLEEESV